MLKRTLSLVLAFVMVFSLMPLNALAEEPGTDEIEELLLDTTDVPEEAETTAPIETESETEAVETEAPTVPETVPATVPETEPDTTLEPDSETTEETVQGEEPAELLTPAAQAAGGTWTLGESKTLALPGGQVYSSPDKLASVTPDYTFTFAPDRAGRYIFCWDNSQNRGLGPHVRITCGEGTYGSGNVYAAFPVTENDINDHLVYTVNVYSQCKEPYSAEIYLKEVTTDGSISFPQQNLNMAKGQTSQFLLNRSPMNYPFEGVDFESSDPNVVEIQSTSFGGCELRAVSGGTATITATDANGQTATCTVTVETYEEWALDETKTLSLSGDSGDPWHMDQLNPSCIFTFTPEADGEYIVCWDNAQNRGYGPHVVVQGPGVYESGNVYNAFHGVAGGTYTIKVYAMADESYEAELWLTKSTKTGSISFGEARTTAAQGEHFWLSVERSSFNYLSGGVTFTSSNPNCVRVVTSDFSACELEAVAPGTAKITAKDANGKTVTHSFTVQPAPDSIESGYPVSKTLPKDGATSLRFRAPEDLEPDTWYTIWNNRVDTYVDLEVVETETNDQIGGRINVLHFQPEAGRLYTVNLLNLNDWDIECEIHAELSVEPTALRTRAEADTGYEGKLNSYGVRCETEPFYARVIAKKLSVDASPGDKVYVDENNNGEGINFPTEVTMATLVPNQPGKATITTKYECEDGRKLSDAFTFTVLPAETATLGESKWVTIPADDSVPLRVDLAGVKEGTSISVWEENGKPVYIYATDPYYVSGTGSIRFDATDTDAKTCLITLTNRTWNTQTYCIRVDQTGSVSGDPITLADQTIYVGESVDLFAKLSPSLSLPLGSGISWKASNKKIELLGAYDNQARFRGISAGTVTVTATAVDENGQPVTATCKVTVLANPAALVAGKWVYGTVMDGSEPGWTTYSFTPTSTGLYALRDEYLSAVNIRVIDPVAGDEDDLGNGRNYDFVKGRKYYITVSATEDVPQNYALRVDKCVDPTVLSIDPEVSVIAAGESVRLWGYSMPEYSYYGRLTWSVDEGAATIRVDNNSESCVVTMKKAGTAIVSAKTANGLTAQTRIVAVESIEALTPGEKKPAYVNNSSLPTVFTFSPEVPGEYVLRETSGKELRYTVYDGANYYADGIGTLRFTANGGRTYRIAVNAYYGSRGDCSFLIEPVTPQVQSISFGYTEPIKAYVGEVIELPLTWDPINSDRGQVTWDVTDSKGEYVDGVRILGCWNDGADIQVLKAGSYQVTATAVGLDDPATVTLTATAAPDPFVKNKEMNLEAGKEKTFVFKADSTGDHTLWAESNDEWVELTVTDQATGQSVSGSNVLHGYLVAGHQYTVVFRNGNGNPVSFTAKLEKDVNPTSIRITDYDEISAVGEYLWLQVSSLPVNSKLSSVNWSIDKTDVAEILYRDNNGCRIRLKQAGSFTVTASSNGATATKRVSVTATGDLTNQEFTLAPNTCASFWFKASDTKDYTAYHECDEFLWVTVEDLSGCVVSDGLGGATFRGIAGETYLVKFSNNNDAEVTTKLKVDLCSLSAKINLESIDGTKTYYVGETALVRASYEPKNAKRGQIVWSGTDGVEIVEEYGVEAQVWFTGSEGNPTVTATATDGSATCTLAFTVLSVDEIKESDRIEQKLEYGAHRIYSFTATTAGDYVFYDENIVNRCSLVLLDSDGEELASGRRIDFHAEEGETYQLGVINDTDAEAQLALRLEQAEALCDLYLPERINGTVGSTIDIIAYFAPANARMDDISWSVDNANVAQITEADADLASIQLLAPGTATLTVRCGGQKATCTITVKSPVAFEPGTVRKVTLAHGESVHYQFTALQAGTYVLWDEGMQDVRFIAYDKDGRPVDSAYEDRLVITDAKAGEVYDIEVRNNNSRAAALTLHLEQSTSDGKATLSFAQGENLVLYLNNESDSPEYVEVNVIMEPYNRVDVAFVASTTVDTDAVNVQELSRPGHYQISAEKAGTTVLTVTDIVSGKQATMTITVKDREALAIGVPATMKGSAVSMGLSKFTPAVDGSYALEVTAPEGYSVEVFCGYTYDKLRNGQSVRLVVPEEDTEYFLATRLLDAQGNPASGDYSICVIPDLPAGSNPISSKGSVQLRMTDSAKTVFDMFDFHPAITEDVLANLVLAEQATFTSADETIATIDSNGAIQPQKSGTAYVTCTLKLGSKTYGAQCRVDVLPDVTAEIADVQYSTTSPVVELYKTDYTTFTAIPYKQTVEGRQVLREALTTPITGAKFTTRKDKPTDAETAEVTFLNDNFKLNLLDNRTIQIVPDAGMANAVYTKSVSVKGSYDVKLMLTFADGTEKTTNFRLNIRKTEPKLTSTKMVFNAFLRLGTGKYESLPIPLKGGTVLERGIKSNPEKENDRTNALGKWLALDFDGLNTDGLTLAYREGYEKTKSYSGNVFLLVDTAEWVVPAKVTVPVSVSYKARGLKLSAASVTMGGGDACEHSKGVNLNLLCTNRKESLELQNVEGLFSEDESFSVRNFDRTTGSFTLFPEAKITSSTEVKLGVLFGDTAERVYLKVKVTPKAVTLAAKPSSFKLNCVRGDCAVINLVPTPADYAINSLDDIEWTLVDSKGNSAESLFDVYFEGGTLRAETTDKTVPGTTYKLIANVPGSTKKTTITLSTLTEKQSQITASAKISGAIDLTFPDSYVAIQPTLSNYLSKDYTFDYQITDSKGNEIDNITKLFRLVCVNGQYRLMANDPTHDLIPGTYYLKPIVTLADGRNPNPDRFALARFVVKRSAVSLKVSKTKVTLNQQIGDRVALDVTCLTKGYDFVKPSITKVVPRGFTAADLDNLKAEYVDGKLLISLTGVNEAYYGKTFTISLKDRRDVREDRAVNVSVVIPKKDVQIGAKLAVKGYVDIVRGSTSAIITPTYLNYSGEGSLSPVIHIVKYSVSDRNYLTPVGKADEDFDVVRNDNGTFTVTRKPGVQIDLVHYKYRAEMGFGENAPDGLTTTPVVALPVRSNSVRVTTIGTPVLYKSDRYSRATFRLDIPDAAVNSIQDVTSNNSQYQVEYLGNGECAIYFNTKTWTPITRYAGSVQLNVFVDGNANAAVKTTVRLTIK